jgi:hypothetical protein
MKTIITVVLKHEYLSDPVTVDVILTTETEARMLDNELQVVTHAFITVPNTPTRGLSQSLSFALSHLECGSTIAPATFHNETMTRALGVIHDWQVTHASSWKLSCEVMS